MITSAAVLATLPDRFVILDHGFMAIRCGRGWLYSDNAFHEPQLPVRAMRVAPY